MKHHCMLTALAKVQHLSELSLVGFCRCQPTTVPDPSQATVSSLTSQSRQSPQPHILISSVPVVLAKSEAEPSFEIL